MAIPSWPASLPQRLRAPGYGQSAADTMIASQTDTGPGKRRNRTSAGVEPFQASLRLSTAQLTQLREFYGTTLGNGALRFSWVDPVSQEPREVRFQANAPPQWQQSVRPWWDVTLALEILP